MGDKVPVIGIQNRTHYFFNDIINIEIFDPDKIRIYEKSYKNILIYYIGYVTIKDSKCIKINSVSPLYFIFNKMNGYFSEINENKYLMLAPCKSKEKNKKI